MNIQNCWRWQQWIDTWNQSIKVPEINLNTNIPLIKSAKSRQGINETLGKRNWCKRHDDCSGNSQYEVIAQRWYAGIGSYKKDIHRGNELPMLRVSPLSWSIMFFVTAVGAWQFSPNLMKFSQGKCQSSTGTNQKKAQSSTKCSLNHIEGGGFMAFKHE